MSWAVLAIGTFYFILGILMNANSNWQSQVIFKAVPMLSGMFLIALAAQMLGWFAS